MNASLPSPTSSSCLAATALAVVLILAWLWRAWEEDLAAAAATAGGLLRFRSLPSPGTSAPTTPPPLPAPSSSPTTTTTTTTPTNPPILGWYPHRGYWHEASGCLPEQAITTDPATPLQCAPNGTIALRVSTTSWKATCGGIPLERGLCVFPSTGTYQYEPDFAAKQQSLQTTFSNQTRMCGSKPFDLSDLRRGMFDAHEWYASSAQAGCLWEDPNPKWFVEKFGGKVILMYGDSHNRNLFTAMVGVIRNVLLVTERHPEKWIKQQLKPAYRMEIRTTHDRVEHFSTVLSREELLTTRRHKQGCGKDCVVLLWTWASTLVEVIELMHTLVEALLPDVLISNWMDRAYEYNRLSPMWRPMAESLERYFLYHYQLTGRPVSYVAVPFAFDPSYPTVKLFHWMNDVNRNATLNRTVLFHHVYAMDVVRAAQANHVSIATFLLSRHSVCTWYPNFLMYPGNASQHDPVGMHQLFALDNCTCASEKATAVVVANLASLSVSSWTAPNPMPEPL